MAFLEICNLSKKFGETVAVRSFELQVERGELVSLLGPSGCGKTTVLRMIAGFEVPSGGKVMFDGQDVTDRPPNQRNVGMVFQSYALFPNLTVARNIGFGLSLGKTPAEERQARVSELLEMIQMTKYANRYPFQLSGGQQQRVALARALALRPAMLLLDEPLSALDARIRVELRADIRAIQRELGITAVYVTHDQEEALSISDRTVVMHEGQIEQVGTPFDIYNFPETAFVANFVGTLNTAKAEIVDPGRHVLRIDGFQLQTAGGMDGKRAGDQISIAVRPERLHFVGRERADNILDCQIDNVTFLGSVVRIQLLIGKHRFCMDAFNDPHMQLPRIGDQTRVGCTREAVLVLR